MLREFSDVLLIMWLVEHFVHQVLSNHSLNVTNERVDCRPTPCIDVYNNMTAVWLLYSGRACYSS